MVEEAARRGSQLVVFPELWSTGYDLKRASSYATTVDDGHFCGSIRFGATAPD